MKSHSRRIALSAVLSSIVIAGSAHAGIVYSLSGDWSDSSNPNGVWSYNETIGIPLTNHFSSWDTADFGSTQPAWALSASAVPAWFKSTGHTTGFDMPTGRVIVHATDPASDTTNVTWTSPFAGKISISGDTWLARKIGRSDDYSLLLNGSTTLASGTITSADSFTSSAPLSFGNIIQQVNVGDVITFEAVQHSGSLAEFAGVDLTITAIPEPSSFVSLACTLAGLAGYAWRKRRCHAVVIQ